MIEINDQRIIDELTEGQKLTGERLQKAFVNRFNSQLRGGLMECVWREKCSSEKDEYFKSKLILSVLFPTGQIMLSVLFRENPLLAIIIDSAIIFGSYGIINSLRQSHPRAIKFSSARNIDHPYECFMPPVEIDKVARTSAHLAGKGRTLVRGTQEK